jgi:hypothetical protein
LPIHSGLDPDDDAAGGAVRRSGIDRVLDPPVVASAGLVDREDELPPRARHIPGRRVVLGAGARSAEAADDESSSAAVVAAALPAGESTRFNSMPAPEPRTTTIPAEGMRGRFRANRCKSKDGVCNLSQPLGAGYTTATCILARQQVAMLARAVFSWCLTRYACMGTQVGA